MPGVRERRQPDLVEAFDRATLAAFAVRFPFLTGGGPGLALAQRDTVIAIDGDGSVLTNLGTLPTIGNNLADNFILLIIDNGSYGSIGDQPTCAGKKIPACRREISGRIRGVATAAGL